MQQHFRVNGSEVELRYSFAIEKGDHVVNFEVVHHCVDHVVNGETVMRTPRRVTVEGDIPMKVKSGIEWHLSQNQYVKAAKIVEDYVACLP